MGVGINNYNPKFSITTYDFKEFYKLMLVMIRVVVFMLHIYPLL